MRKKGFWVLLGLLVASLTFALAGCGGGKSKDKYKLNETSVELTVGGTKQLTVTPEPEGEITWTSDHEEIATVENGLVTAVAEGSAKITAAFDGADEPLVCTVTVREPSSAGGGYSLNLSSVALKTGEEKQLTVTDKNGAAATGVTWSSENAQIASVSNTGLVKAVAVGSTNVKAVVDGETLTCAVTVSQKYTYSLDKTSLDIAAGGSEKITLNVTPELTGEARPHTFRSENPAVATVDGGTGVVTGVAKGTATIVCSVDGEELEATVKVTEYTVKVDGVEMGENITLRVGEADKHITVESDPARTDVTPEYKTGNAQFVTVEGGTLHAVAAGSTTITVTVGKRDFTANVTVSAAVQYALKADGEDIEDDALSMKLGDTVTLSVVRDPAGTQALTVQYSSATAEVASVVNETGVVTAAKVGSAEITVTVTDPEATSQEPIVFHITVNVVLESSIAEETFVFGEKAIDLTYLDENKTLDWYKYWFNDQGQNKIRMKNNAGLISDYTMASGVNDEEFWDYPVPVIYDDADAEKAFGGNTYGRAVHGSYSITVKITNAVSKIVLLTGTWKETATVQFKLGDAVLQETTIVGSNEGDPPPSTPKGITLTIDTASLTEELTLTIAVNCAQAHGGNVSLVAAAVIGKVPHDNKPTVETDIAIQKGAGGAFDLTELGNLDWVAVKNGGVYRKAGVPENTYIKTNAITYRDPDNGNFGDDYGKDEGGTAHFTWTDGTESVPSSDVHNFKWANDFASIPVALTKGNFTVTLFATGWSSAYMVGVYDNHGTFIQGKQVTPTTNQGVTAKVTITLDVKEAGDYTFKVIKLRDSNCGWAAIAVSQNSEYSLEKNTFNLTLGGTTGQKIVVKKGGESYTTDVSFKSGDSQIVEVDQSDGTLTAKQKGTATVTVTVGEEEFLVFVTVTEYTLKSGTDITLSKDSTSQIEIEADPKHEFTAEYKVTVGDTYVDVTPEGVISAKAKGEATVTATVDGKVFTITVHVVEYKLDQTEITLTLGGEPATATLKMTEGDEGSDVSGVEFTSQDEKIASVVKDTGVITAVGFGQTTIEAKKDSTVLECTVIVKLKVTPSEKDYADGSNETVNLDEIDDTNVTLDWRYFGRDGFTEEKKDGDLISEVTGNKAADFYDYKAKINWFNGAVVEQGYLNRVDGITYKEAASFTVKLTKDAKYISVFAGAWHAKITVSLAYDGVEYAKQEFTNTGDGNSEKNKQLVFAPDMEHFGQEEKTFTVTITPTLDGDGAANASLVAIAVIGNTARGQKAAAAGSATETHSALTPEQDNTINLSEVGTLDWAYINNNGNNGMVRKSGGTAIGAFMGTGKPGNGDDGFGTKHQFFTWTGGTSEPDGGDGEHTKTNKIKSWDGSAISIAVKLEASATVTLYLSAWQPTCTLDVYDAHGNKLIDNATVLECSGTDGASKIEVKITVTEASNFTFVINKTPQGNVALGAIAVANAAE